MIYAGGAFEIVIDRFGSYAPPSIRIWQWLGRFVKLVKAARA